MDDAGLTPAECRRVRKDAQVSIHELARKLHRDPSSLSRWERGLQVPRDVAQVIAAYQELEPVVRVDAAEPQSGHTTSFNVSLPFIALLVLRWVALALVVTFGAQIDAGKTFDPDAVRIFICGSAVLAIVIMMARYARRASAIGHGADFIVVSWALSMIFLSQASWRRIGEQRLTVQAGFAILIIEIGLMGLSWRTSGDSST